MLKDRLKDYRIILASGSPRRKHLMEEMGLAFTTIPKHINESFPETLSPREAAEYLSRKKAEVFSDHELRGNFLLITADTIVTLDGKILGKPADRGEAVDILERLSGRTHQVITGVTLRTAERLHTFSVTTDVTFKRLSGEEIAYYIDNWQPYDKAGAYGIQEWIGHVATERIRGSYFNVMGLPTHQLYEELLRITG